MNLGHHPWGRVLVTLTMIVLIGIFSACGGSSGGDSATGGTVTTPADADDDDDLGAGTHSDDDDDDASDDDVVSDDDDDDVSDDDVVDDDVVDDDVSDDDDDVVDPNAPILDAVSPAVGNNLLTQTLTLTGSNLKKAWWVKFGSQKLIRSEFTIVDDTTITLSLPQGMATGNYDVSVGIGEKESRIVGGFELRNVIHPYVYIDGLVLDREGEPVFGIAANAPSSAGVDFTDEAGRFRLAVSPRFGATVEISNNAGGLMVPRGRLLSKTFSTEEMASDIDYTAQLDYYLINGSVVNHIADPEGGDDIPLPPVEVQFFEKRENGGLTLRGSAFVDGEGHYGLALPAAKYTVRVDPLYTEWGPDAERVVAGLTMLDFIVDRDDPEQLQDMELFEGREIYGDVLDRDGTPIGPFTVLPSPVIEDRTQSFFTSADVTTGAGRWETRLMDGAYDFALLPKTGVLPIDLPPFDSRRFGRVDVGGEGTEPLIFQFDYAHMFAQVTDELGAQVDFPVTVELLDRERNFQRFEINGEDTGAFFAMVWKDKLEAAITPPFGTGYAKTWITFNEITDDFSPNLALQPASMQSGAITDAEGNPIQAATVTFYEIGGEPGSLFQHYYRATTDENGEYLIAVPDGDYIVEAWLAVEGMYGRIGRKDDVVVSGSGDLVWETAFRTLTAQLFGADGKPLENAEISMSSFETQTSAFGMTDKLGRVELPFVPGNYEFRLNGPDPATLRPVITEQMQIADDAELVYSFTE
ncbi:MAG: carboxypeptidase regulatory-like domain-containing protein [Deltaproteobacteria bacterium]|nr:carboxypeptidase regulatory-like domain-containing protein [Deltaproteobacteria bacterium]